MIYSPILYNIDFIKWGLTKDFRFIILLKSLLNLILQHTSLFYFILLFLPAIKLKLVCKVLINKSTSLEVKL